MPFRFKKTPEYAGQSAKLINLGLGGRLGTPSISPGGGGGGGTGTALDPYVLLTDGTPLLFTIDSSVNAEYRADTEGDGVYYGKYVTFTCPALASNQTLRVRYGIQTDFVDYLDTYMYAFEGATWNGFNTYVDEDDDGGAGYYDEFENTLLEFPDGALTEGNSYIIEATTFDTAEAGNVKMIADVVTAPLELTYGGTPINSGDTLLIVGFGVFDSNYADKSYTVFTCDSSFNAVSMIDSGTLPVTSTAIDWASSYGSTYSQSVLPGFTSYYFAMTASGISFVVNIPEISGGGGGGDPPV